MKKRVFCKILASVALLLLLALLGGCGKERQIVKKVHLSEPYLITFSGLSYENDPEACTYVRYGIDGQGNILLETASYDTEGVRLEAGHLYIKRGEGGYTHYTDEGRGYVLASEERIGSSAINAAHFQDLYLFQLRLNDATTLHENAAFEEKGQSVFLGRTCTLYTVQTKGVQEDTGEKYTALYEYTVDAETGGCLRVSYGILGEGQEHREKSGFVCTEFDLAPEDFSTLLP